MRNLKNVCALCLAIGLLTSACLDSDLQPVLSKPGSEGDTDTPSDIVESTGVGEETDSVNEIYDETDEDMDTEDSSEGIGGDGDADMDTDGDADGDADTDADTDVDGDADTNVDTDVDGDTDTDADVTEGGLIWVQQAGGSASSYCSGLTVLPDGASVVAGSFGYGDIVFGEGTEKEITYTSSNAYDVFIAKYDADGNLAWSKQQGGENGDGADSIATASDGSILVAGTFDGPVVFGAGEDGETELTESGAFIEKLNPDGLLAWAASIVAGDWLGINDIEGTDDGGLVVTGFFLDTVRFGAGAINETSLTTNNPDSYDIDIFIAKYASDGTFLWTRRIGGDSDEQIAQVFPLSDGSVFVAGFSASESTVFDEGEGSEIILPNVNGCDAFLSSYGPDGTLAWANRTCGGWGSSTTGGDGETVISMASYTDEIVLGYGEPNETTLTTDVNRRVYMAEYNFDGTLAWAGNVGLSSSASIASVAAFADDVFMTGDMDFGSIAFGESGEMSFSSSTYGDIYLAKYNSGGKLAWAKVPVRSDYASVCGVAPAPDGAAAFLAGAFESTATFWEGEANETTLTPGDNDIFIAKFAN